MRKRGQGWKGDSERHKQVGAIGGAVTAKKFGQDYFKMIGRKGGQANKGKAKKSWK